MPLDPSIPLGVRTVQQPFNNPFEQLLELRNQQERRKLAQQELEQRQQELGQSQQRIDIDRKSADAEQKDRLTKQQITETAEQAYSMIQDGNADQILGAMPPQPRALAEGWLKSFAESKAKREQESLVAAKQAAKVAQAMDYDPVTTATMIRMLSDVYPSMSQAMDHVEDREKRKALIDKFATLGDQPKPDYTLNPNDVRMSGENQQVASNPVAPAAKVAPEPKNIDEMIAAAFKVNDGKAINELLTVKAKIAASTREPKATPTASEAGWSIQQASDPATNTTRMMRVNSRTGEVQEVKLPGDLQAGGQRQTRLTAAQQEDLATMATVQDMSKELTRLGEKIGWQGVGGMGYGTVAEFLTKQFGTGSEDAVKLRALVGNVKGTIAKLRGGTSFTANEQKLLDTYTPGINESVLSIKAKLSGLDDFIETKRKNTMKFAGADMGSATPKTQEPDAVEEWVRDPKTGKLTKKAK